MQVNALGSLWLVNAVLPGMKARGSGKIVLVSSVGGGVSQFPGELLSLTCEVVMQTFVVEGKGATHAGARCTHGRLHSEQVHLID